MFGKLLKWMIMLSLVVILPYAIVWFMQEDVLRVNLSPNGFEEELENYCIQTLAKEVSSNYEDEMLKVQAILVRTTVYKQVKELGNDIKQVEDIDFLWRKRLKEAWDATEGQVVLYENELALVPFHQVSNGKTRDGEEVLGDDQYEYLQVLECDQDVMATNQLASHFIEEKNVAIEKWDSAGYVTSVKVGEEILSGEAFREKYGLASSCFEVQPFEEKTRVVTKGVGHGLGLSQFAANEMAKDGKTCEEILTFFFPGTEIKEVAEILWNVE